MKYAPFLLALLCCVEPPPEPIPEVPVDSPAWQIPVNLAPDETVLDYGVIESDSRGRMLRIRLVSSTDIGPNGLHGPRSVFADIGEQWVSGEPLAPIDGGGPVVPVITEHRPHLVQVWRENIAAVNTGKLVGAWVSTLESGTKYFSAISGNGAGTMTYMQGFVDWMEP